MKNPYHIDEATQAHIETNFCHYMPLAEQEERYLLISNVAMNMAQIIVSNTPKSSEQSVALTSLENAVFWANAAIARNEKGGQ